MSVAMCDLPLGSLADRTMVRRMADSRAQPLAELAARLLAAGGPSLRLDLNLDRRTMLLRGAGCNYEIAALGLFLAAH